MTEDRDLLLRKLEREKAARREAERLLEEKSDELYESLVRTQSGEDLLNSALASMTDGLLLTTREHDVALSNPQLRDLYPNHAHLFETGNNLSGYFRLLLEHPTYRSILAGETEQEFFEVSLEDGRDLSVGVRLTREGMIASSHRDITNLKADEEQRRGLLFDLMAAQRLEAIGRMAGMIAHDFNNIVASIKGYAGFLFDDLPEDDPLRSPTTRILAAAERAEGLIQQILDYGQERRVPRFPVSLVPVLEDCCEMAMAHKPADARLLFDPPEKPIWVRGDETQIARLFTNLLRNALKAVSGQGGKITLSLELIDGFDAQKDKTSFSQSPGTELCSNQKGATVLFDSAVRITVTDNGIGMTEHVMKRIFDMYFSTRESGRAGGLGMASVASIIADTGGFVRLTSAAGYGTAVEVVFPTTIPDENTHLSTGVRNEGRQLQMSDVLVVDDEEDVGELIRQTLEREGISAQYLNSAEAAEELIRANPGHWRMVICDQNMPRVKGSEFHDRLQSAGIDIPFILCSAQVDAADHGILNQLGDRFIPKPIDRQLLVETVRKYL